MTLNPHLSWEQALPYIKELEEPITIVPKDPITRDEDFLLWLKDHGIEPIDCYMVKVNRHELVAYCYARNENGRKYVDLEKGEIAKAEPITVAL